MNLSDIVRCVPPRHESLTNAVGDVEVSWRGTCPSHMRKQIDSVRGASVVTNNGVSVLTIVPVFFSRSEYTDARRIVSLPPRSFAKENYTTRMTMDALKVSDKVVWRSRGYRVSMYYEGGAIKDVRKVIKNIPKKERIKYIFMDGNHIVSRHSQKEKHPDNPRTVIAFLGYINTNLMWNLSKMNCSAVSVYFVRDE